MNRWQSYDFDDLRRWADIPTCGGCYVVYCDGQLAYIGQAETNVKKRMQSYKINYGYSNTIYTPWGGCSSVQIKVRSPKRFGEWAMTELRLIKRTSAQAQLCRKHPKSEAKTRSILKAVGQIV
jgi:hypothetical protein